MECAASLPKGVGFGLHPDMYMLGVKQIVWWKIDLLLSRHR